VSAVPAAHPGEALFQVAAAKVLGDRLADDRPEEPVAVLVALRVDLLEALVVLLDKAVERGLARAARSVDALGALDHAGGQVQDAGRPR